MPKRISICIPAFNEAANLPVAVEAVERLFREELGAYELEIIITDNASTDSTWEVVNRLAADRPHLKAFRFSRNFGYQNSVFAGISMATGSAVVELDADLEDPPAVIPKFVEKWEAGFDVAYGVRATRHGSWFLRLAFSLFYRLLNKLSDFPIPKDSGDFRLLDRRVVEVLRNLPERNLYLRGLVSYLGFRQAEVLYDRQPRIGGASKFSFLHYLTLAVDALTAFSKAPLRLIGILGIILFVLSMLLSLYYLYGRILHGTPLPGFTTLVVLTLMLNSVTFIFLGVLGEYLSRVFDDAKNRPRVIFRDSINADGVPPCL
ncbi:MAG: glycosyltransferase family 2 protein [Holophagaceae bacterium]|nr:glycosyltransferase family 2 protein [Holophagaceae bacterium]